MADPTLEQLDTVRVNLAGVGRVFLSGGAPLLRRDLREIVDMFSPFILGLPTNTTRGLAMAPRLAGKVGFVNIGFDGGVPRSPGSAATMTMVSTGESTAAGTRHPAPRGRRSVPT